jgi:hypothetical protein
LWAGAGKKRKGKGWPLGWAERRERKRRFGVLFFLNPLLIKSFQVFKNYFKNF